MRSGTLIILMVAVMAVFSAEALTITPTWTPSWNGDDTFFPDGTLTPLSAAQVETVVGLAAGTLMEVYKDEITDEEGTLADSYETVYTPSSADPSGATISYVSGPSISSTVSAYLGVKDGDNSP